MGIIVSVSWAEIRNEKTIKTIVNAKNVTTAVFKSGVFSTFIKQVIHKTNVNE